MSGVWTVSNLALMYDIRSTECFHITPEYPNPNHDSAVAVTCLKIKVRERNCLEEL